MWAKHLHIYSSRRNYGSVHFWSTFLVQHAKLDACYLPSPGQGCWLDDRIWIRLSWRMHLDSAAATLHMIRMASAVHYRAYLPRFHLPHKYIHQNEMRPIEINNECIIWRNKPFGKRRKSSSSFTSGRSKSKFNTFGCRNWSLAPLETESIFPLSLVGS